VLPPEGIDGLLVMPHQHAAHTPGALLESGDTAAGPTLVFHDTPEAFHRMEMVTAAGGQALQPTARLPMGQRRGERVRPVAATVIDDHHHLLPSGRKGRHHWMALLSQPLSSHCGTILEKTFAVPYWTAPMMRSKTPLVIRFQERERLQASRLRASSCLMCPRVRGRRGRRERWAWRRYQHRGGQSATGAFRRHRARGSRLDGPGTQASPVRQRRPRGLPGQAPAAQWDDSSSPPVFEKAADTCTPELDTSVGGSHGRECATDPLGGACAVLEGS